MLRVRPLHFTSRMDSWDRLLTALGMVRTEDDAGWQVFDAGSGRLALHAVPEGAEDGSTALAVEVGDLAEFARRTNLAAEEDGAAPAELVTADHGESCRITAPDGFSFLADKAAHAARCADADPALAVVGVWFTEDPASASRTLHQVGARPRPVPDQDDTADFTAKNGGVLMVRPASGRGRVCRCLMNIIHFIAIPLASVAIGHNTAAEPVYHIDFARCRPCEVSSEPPSWPWCF